MKRIVFSILILLLASCAVVTELQSDGKSSDWTIFRGSPSLCGYTDCSLPEVPQMVWSVSTKTRTVAAPIVYNGVVYMLSRKGELRGYTTDGDSCAYCNLNTTVEASFVVTDSVLYVGRIDGFVSAYRTKDIVNPKASDPNNPKASEAQKLTPLWEYETMGQISGSPNMVGRNVLVGSYDNCMYTFDAMTGEKRCQFETGYYINGTAAVWGKYMVFGGCDAWIRVVDTTTGVMTDSLELDSYVPASPAILDGVACAADYNGNVYEMRLEEGKIASHKKLLSVDVSREGQDGGSVSMPTLSHDAAFVLSGEKHIVCIERGTGKVRWKKMLRGIAGECSPLVARDKVLVCTKDGHVSILSASDGEELWHYDAGEQIIASPAIVNERFFILTSRGTLLCFN